MRRTERLEHTKPETGFWRNHTREKRPSWIPRARRLKLDSPLRYRVNNTATWYDGTIENISQSGVLFHGPQPLPANALIEMLFEMPEEISGQKDRNVICQGRIIRGEDQAVKDPTKHSAKNKDQEREATTRVMAASIVDYKYIR